jgi:hypothetical protein
MYIDCQNPPPAVVKIGYLNQQLQGIAIGYVTKTGGPIPGFLFPRRSSNLTVAAHQPLVEIELIGHVKDRDIKADARLISFRQDDLKAVGSVAHSGERFPVELVTGPVGRNSDGHPRGMAVTEVLRGEELLPVEQPFSIQPDDGLLIQNGAA